MIVHGMIRHRRRLKRSWWIASVLLACAIPSLVAASTVPGAMRSQIRHPATRGTMLARRMASALAHQGRIEVRGSLGGPGTQVIQFLVRYQASGREFLQETGGVWDEVQIGRRRMGAVESVSLGRRLYSSTDGKHWTTGSRLIPASPLDAISINPVMAPCCVSGTTADAQVMHARSQRSRFGPVYALDYIATSATASIKGTLLLDRRTYLPRQYTEYSDAPRLRGRFTLTFGGRFTIQAPH